MSEEKEEPETTGQNDFFTVLENLSPTESNIIVRQPLSGDIDCSVLSKCNFTGITGLQFAPGNITGLRNIPKGVTKIVCAENQLAQMPAELPDSLIELDLHSNRIDELVTELPEGLKELNLSDNRIESLANLPRDLEVLRCEGNRMKVLKLEGITRLRILLCGSNPQLVIENVPDSLEEFESDTDIVVEIRGTDKGEHEAVEQKSNYQEALFNYFELKKEYDNKVVEAKRAIYRESKTKKQARMKMKMLKPKCLYCDRPVGSIFKIEIRKYIARCGDEQHPCPFHIELFRGEYAKITDMMESYHRTVEFAKQSIIEDKLNVLYQYLTEKDGVEFFKDNLDYYTTQSVHLASLTKEYTDLYFNEETEEKVLAKRKKIAEIRDRMAEMIRNSTESEDFLKDIAAMYCEELVPEIKNLALIQWQTREMIENPLTGQIELFQLPYRISQLEYTFGEYPRVVHYKVRD